jgi:hypothetical protein
MEDKDKEWNPHPDERGIFSLPSDRFGTLFQTWVLEFGPENK